MRQALKNVDAVQTAMIKLAQISVVWGKRVLYLTVHTRKDSPQPA